MDLLADGLMDTAEVNYNPLYENLSQNLFKKIRSGIFKNSSYIVLEDDNGYVGSSGWYEYDENTAIVFVRTYLRKDMRQKHLLSKYFLPEFFSLKYKKLWITVNEHNKALVNGFTRVGKSKGSSVGFSWNKEYAKFKPIGTKYINGLEQYIIEYEK